MAVKPEVDIEKAATEMKAFIDAKKFDMVDYSYVNIEVYPPHDEEKYPELCKFSKQWSSFFDEAEKALESSTETPGDLTFTQILAKYSPDLAAGLELFDAKTAQVAAIVNADQQFWEKIRGIVLPLYEKSAYYEQWKDARWKSVDISYDPTPLEVVTTQMWTNKKTGERIRGEKIRTSEYPAGFVVRIN